MKRVLLAFLHDERSEVSGRFAIGLFAVAIPVIILAFILVLRAS